jgi:hypothetical protein
MNVPIPFPSEAESVREETRRFRALTPDERVHALEEMFRLYHFLVKTSDRPETLARFAQEEEERARANIQQFVARHG